MSSIEPFNSVEDATKATEVTDVKSIEPSKTGEVNPNKKRKVALFISYVGHGYQGMQRNPGAKTIEEDLFRAVSQAGGISEANSDERGFQKIHFMRAARTDKGVSAVGQVCSFMMILNPPGIIERINEKLPPAIRAYGYRRVTKGFDARKACDKRRYEYIMPFWMFDPEVKGLYIPRSSNDVDTNNNEADGGQPDDGAQGNKVMNSENLGDDAQDGDAADILAAEKADDDVDVDDGSCTHPQSDTSIPTFEPNSTMVFDQSRVDKMNAILKQYEGTHNFHNYTVRTAASDPAAKRYILSFTCEGTFSIEGCDTPWVRLVVIGQSFMLHQIRKMVGMALAEFRGDAPAGCLRYALNTHQHLNTPMAPDLGLFLDECYYDAYNKKYGVLHEPLNLGDWQEEVNNFKDAKLYPALAGRDTREQVNAIWLSRISTGNIHRFKQWLERPDTKRIKVIVAAPEKKKREVDQAALQTNNDEANIMENQKDAGVVTDDAHKRPKIESASLLIESLQAEYSE